MPDISRAIKLRYAQPTLSNASTFTNTNSDVVISVDTDGLGGDLYFVLTESSTLLADSAIVASGESVNVTAAGTYQLDHSLAISGSTTYYLNVVHLNGTVYSNVVQYSVTTPAAPDTEAPLISLIGDAVESVTQGNAWGDQGANVTDNVDADRVIYSSGSVDTDTVGAYSLHYDTQDAAGNNAARVTRTVNVVAEVFTVSRAIKLRYIACRVDLFRDVGRGKTTSINIGLPAITPTLGNTTVNGLTVTSVVDNGDGTYTINATVPVDLAKQHGTQDFDIAIGAHTITAQSEVLPQENWFVTDVVNPSVNDGNIFNNYTGDAPETGAEIEYTVTQIEAGLAFEYAPDGNGIVSWADTNNTSDVVITDDIIVQARYIAPNGAIGSTATLTYEVDRVAPTLTLVGSNPLTWAQGTPWVDPTATLSDNIDDDRPITADTQPDTDTVATYIIDYNGADSSANDAVTVSRTVNVIDTTAPIISLNGSAFVEVGQGATYTDAGANATDNNDLSVTVTPSGSVNTSVIGSYTITYNAIDTAGNAASPVFRTVNVVDNDAPIITLLGQAVVTHIHGTPFVDSGASAVDAVDGSVSVTISGTVNVNAIGSYTLTYTAQDSNGNDATPVTRTINVVDQTKPTITLLGSATINHQQYEAYTDAGVTVFDNVDGSGLAATPSGSVNVNAVGLYTITYTATDSAGNIAEPVTRTINVVSAGDITPPVISLVGDATVLHEQGTTYSDAGATALDNIEGDISADIVVSGGVNVNIADTYTITYTVSDSDGNSATPTTRTVVVQDTLKPAIMDVCCGWSS